MGCVLSSFDEDGKVGICKERKKLIKQLVGIRGEFSDSLLAYLKALRNTGATLRQLTESDVLEFDTASNDVLEFDTASNGAVAPPPMHVHLPSSSPVLLPPPLPPHLADQTTEQVSQEEIFQNDFDNVRTQPTDAGMGSWIFSTTDQNFEILDSPVEENWEETKTEFEDEDQEGEAVRSVVKSRSGKKPIDDSSCAMSLCRKDITSMQMVVSRKERTLESIVKELDDYFLKASPCVKEIAVLIDNTGGDTLLRQNSWHHNGKGDNSAKVFNILSRSRNSKSPQFARDTAEFSGPSGPCKPGAHCATLKKLYEAEKKLFKAVKEEGIAKMEFERKSLLLQKQENENLDWTKIEKTRSNVENLESDILSLQQSITETTSSILELIDEELLPQLVALTAGLTKMWRTMHKCHQAQALISQRLSNLSDNLNTILNSDYRHQATLQFETEASYWYASFCKLVKSQQEYVRTLNKWIQHTSCLREDHENNGHSSVIRSICEQWELGLDRLPVKEASEAIKSLLSSIRSIIDQQAQEDNILKKLNKLDHRFRKSLSSFTEMEEKFKFTFENGDIPVNMSPTHPLSLKRGKTEALKKQVESMTSSYLSSVHLSKAMTLNSLKTRLPHLFQSLLEFSSVSAEAIEVISNTVKPVECTDDTASQN